MFGYLMVAVCLCFGMASCSEDEESGADSGAGSGAGVEGNAAAKLGDNSFSVPYGYWYEEGPAGNGKKNVQLEFYSWDPTSGEYFSELHFVSFSFDIPEDANGLPGMVLKGGEYDGYVAYNTTMSSPGIQCEWSYYNTENPDLVIERNGDNYTVKVENLKVSDEVNEYNFSFNYSGKLKNERISDGGY